MRFRGTLMSSLVISALALSAAPALAADDHGDGSADVAGRDGARPRPDARAGQGARASCRSARSKLDAELQKSLGDAYAGSQYDLKSGKLIVMVSDRGAAREGQGGRRRAARWSSTACASSTRSRPSSTAAASPAARRAQAAGRAVHELVVDPLSNSVQITATRKQAAAAKELQAKYGDAVSVELSEDVPRPPRTSWTAATDQRQLLLGRLQPAQPVHRPGLPADRRPLRQRRLDPDAARAA